MVMEWFQLHVFRDTEEIQVKAHGISVVLNAAQQNAGQIISHNQKFNAKSDLPSDFLIFSTLVLFKNRLLRCQVRFFLDVTRSISSNFCSTLSFGCVLPQKNCLIFSISCPRILTNIRFVIHQLQFAILTSSTLGVFGSFLYRNRPFPAFLAAKKVP